MAASWQDSGSWAPSARPPATSARLDRAWQLREPGIRHPRDGHRVLPRAEGMTSRGAHNVTLVTADDIRVLAFCGRHGLCAAPRVIHAPGERVQRRAVTNGGQLGADGMQITQRPARLTVRALPPLRIQRGEPDDRGGFRTDDADVRHDGSPCDVAPWAHPVQRGPSRGRFGS